jgi:hypothetical protein
MEFSLLVGVADDDINQTLLFAASPALAPE